VAPCFSLLLVFSYLSSCFLVFFPGKLCFWYLLETKAMVMKMWGCWSNWTLSSVSSSSFLCSECIFVVLWLFPLPFFLVCLYPSFSGLPRFSTFSPILSVLPYVRPFSGFYKAREGRVFMPPEIRHVPWEIMGHDLLVVFLVDPVFRMRRWWTVYVQNDTDFHRKRLFLIWPWTSDI